MDLYLLCPDPDYVASSSVRRCADGFIITEGQVAMESIKSSHSRRSFRCRSALIACAILYVSGSAIAAEQLPRGFYAGGLVGATAFEDDGLFNGYKFDDSGVGYAVFGGYKFFRYLAVEARLSSLGSYSVEDPYTGQNDDFDTSAISAHVVGIIPFGKSGWELFGQLGIGSVKFDADCCGDDNQTMGSAGLGVRFYPSPHLGISLQTDAFAYEEDTYYKSYDLGIVETQLGIQYIF